MRIAATVSGSFHRHMSAISEAVHALHDAGVSVLSPADPRIIDAIGAFLFVASDRHRSVRLVQDRHLAAICASNFLWLVCPDGYVGQSASMEIGFAVARGIPVLASHLPDDLTLRHYVHRVENLSDALQLALPKMELNAQLPSLLIDPEAAINAAHVELTTLQHLLNAGGGGSSLTAEFFVHHNHLTRLTSLPSSR